LFFNLRRLRAKLSNNHTPLTDSELHQKIADAIGVKQSDVAVMNARLSGPDTSLNAPITDSDGSSSDRQDFLVSEAPQPDEIVTENIDAERRSSWLASALTVLSERELKIVRERRLSEDGATLESLGQKLGISKERVRQIESRALQKLKTALLDRQPDQTAYAGTA
jgi:RNA polymerase sigma-32 factor